MTKATTKATVTLTLKVESEGHWGEDATIAEVRRVGGRETIGAVKRALKASGLDYTMTKEPEVGLITWSPAYD